ncbi:MAG: Bax inhibitor-1 family protein [Candidatus Heimdallarchaeota archaeon]|nr:Bax inhibitor-1 family protein [Candidatus Heimdallarchaeota archaeon]
MASLILSKLYNGLLFGTLTAFLTAFFVSDPNTAGIIIVFAFIGEVIAIIGYFFAKNEITIERLYYLFVGSSSALLGFTIQSYLAIEGGSTIVLGAVGITTLIVAYTYNRARTKNPDLNQLSSRLFPLSIVFIVLLIGSWFIQVGSIFMIFFSLFGAILFSLYLYFDFARVMQGAIRSPARSAWRLYWDILLIFRYLLYFLGGVSRR